MRVLPRGFIEYFLPISVLVGCHKFPNSRKNASNIDFSLSEIQAPYPTINKGEEGQVSSQTFYQNIFKVENDPQAFGLILVDLRLLGQTGRFFVYTK